MIPYLEAQVVNLLRPAASHEPDFIVFAQGRSGSTILVDLINKLPNVHCDGEVLGASLPLRVPFKSAYLSGLRKKHLDKRYGYRIKVYDLTQTQGCSWEENISFLQQLIQPNIKVIHLVRDNKFRQAMSSLVAEARGRYHDFEDRMVPEKIRVDAASIPERIRLLNFFSAQELELLRNRAVFKVSYEEDLLKEARHQALLDEIAEFINTQRATATSTYKRSTPDALEDVIDNWNEVQDVLEKNNLMPLFLKEKKYHEQ